jgi:hypothetical protein
MTTTALAHPYDDTDVIDARAPRFNQATVGLVSLVALVTGWWWLLGLLAAQLLLGLRFGRRWCLPCVLYFEVVQPRFGEGPLEDARPPRFANQVGAALLAVATLAYLAGQPVLGTVVGGIVAALALLAAISGLCVGCELYRFVARARGIRAGRIDVVDLAELGAPAGAETLVHFTHPLCSDCAAVERRLRADGRALVTVNVADRPELARRYHVAVVPTAYLVAADGRVRERLA